MIRTEKQLPVTFNNFMTNDNAQTAKALHVDDRELLVSVALVVLKQHGNTNIFIQSDDRHKYKIDKIFAEKILRYFQEARIFKYESGGLIPDDKNKYVRKISFPIGRYGHPNKTLEFGSEVTQKQAIKKVEEWLSGPITEDYFNYIKTNVPNTYYAKVENEDDYPDKRELLYSDLEKEGYHVRGDFLGEAIYLSGFLPFDKNDTSHINLITDSL